MVDFGLGATVLGTKGPVTPYCEKAVFLPSLSVAPSSRPPLGFLSHVFL